jgi:hypothetical protein
MYPFILSISVFTLSYNLGLIGLDFTFLFSDFYYLNLVPIVIVNPPESI